MNNDQQSLMVFGAQQAAIIQLVISIIAKTDAITATQILSELDNFHERYKKTLRQKAPIDPGDKVFFDALDNFVSEIKQKIVIQ